MIDQISMIVNHRILSNNQLSSTIPAEIGNLTTIKNLYLYTNRLTGPIPDLSNLTKLDQLQLQENFLTGTIPSFFTTLPVLSQLYGLTESIFFFVFLSLSASHASIFFLSNPNTSITILKQRFQQLA